jgi:hypothetical protein
LFSTISPAATVWIFRPADAEKAYAEALVICRDLAADNPKIYPARVESLTKQLNELRGPVSASKR